MSNQEFYIVCKFTSGEQVMAVLNSEDDRYVELVNPLLIKSLSTSESNREQLAAQPLCQFSDDSTFLIHKQNILYIKRLHHVFVPHYKRIINECNRSTFVEAGTEEEQSLDWDNETPTPEEAKKLIDILKEMLGDEEREETSFRVFVKGNDTIN